MTIALYHFHVTQIKRSAGQSAVAAAAYRSGEKLHSEYYGEDSDYTKKGGVICSEILLPSYAPPEYADRETLWNEVERAERGKKAQLAYSFDICVKNPSAFWLPEFTLQKEIGGTIYSVTGTYDGTETLDKKMERIMAEKFTEKLEDSE